MTEFRGNVAVVTGGGTGIGRALAKELAKQGALVAVADIMIGNARDVVEEINALSGKAIAIHCDVCERDSISQLKAAVNAELGPVTLLFANAGATSFDPLVDMSDENVDWIIQVNLMGVVNTVRAFLPEMISAGVGHVVATSSMAGLLPGWVPVHSVYSAAKMGVIGLMMNLALEMKDYGINFTTYCPGGVDTGMRLRNATYRPPRFGGPSEGEIPIPKKSFGNNPIPLYPSESIAPIVLRAVRNNRPFVFDHAEQRREFRETYSKVVEACYDDIEDYEREHGTPQVLRRT